jgi:hypothetical protein
MASDAFDFELYFGTKIRMKLKSSYRSLSPVKTAQA